MDDFTLAPYSPISNFVEYDNDLILGAKPRDKKWQTKRLETVRNHPFCAACGMKTELEVHHIRPFEFWPEKELDDNNLIVLCMNPKHNCHFVFGHLFDWRQYNPGIMNMLWILGQRKSFMTRNEDFFREHGL